MIKISNLVTAGVLALSGTVANASTILFPTDGDVNFLVMPTFIESGYSLAIFDDTEAVAPGGVIASSTGLLTVNLADGTFADGGVIDFLGAVGPGGAYQASNQVTLYNFPIDASADNFIVGLSTDGGATWLADTGAIPGPANTVSLTYQVGGPAIVVDVQIIPIPAAVWLFGSGLLGLAAIARRRQAR